MPANLSIRLVNLIAFVALAMVFILIWRKTITAQVQAFQWQSFALAGLTALIAAVGGAIELFGVALAVAAIKGGIVPWVLNRAIRSIGLRRESAPYLSTPIALIVAGLLVTVAYAVMLPLTPVAPPLTAAALPLAFAGILIGLLLTITRRRALTQILGFLVVENSIFMLSLLATFGVPLVVEVGVFLDLLVAVLILEVFVHRIKENFDTHDVDLLGELKG
jgi:hydrogenase-4 component E